MIHLQRPEIHFQLLSQQESLRNLTLDHVWMKSNFLCCAQARLVSDGKERLPAGGGQADPHGAGQRGQRGLRGRLQLLQERGGLAAERGST